MADNKEDNIKDRLDPRAEVPSDDTKEDTDEQEKDLDLEDRKKDYGSTKKVKEQLVDVYDAVVRGFEDKSDQSQTCDRNWDMYNCVLNENQTYQGTSQIYVPLVRDAIEARVTRFTNQIFPQNGRYADVVGTGEIPWDTMAILDHYVRQAKLKSNVIPSLLREGDCSGQYSLFLDWTTKKRHTVRKVKKSDMEDEGMTAKMPDEVKYDDREYAEVTEEKPDVTVLDARNLCILPTSVDDIEDADIVGVAMWVTKARVKRYAKDGIFDKDEADKLIENFDQSNSGNTQQPDTEKKAANQAGVKTDSKGTKRCLLYRVWTEVKIKGERRLCEIWFAGQDRVLSCKRVPFWCDRIPVISKPVLKVPGSIWGKAPAEAVEKLQYQANDAVNMGMDSAQYALLPIVMTNPESNPKIGSMILAQAAIWETNPKDTSFANFPPLYKDALNIVGVCKDQIMQSLGVNPAMMPHASGGKGSKPSQAQAAQEQQVALETTANVVSIMEEAVLNEILYWFYEMDYQFRTKEITIQKFGQMGLQADLQQIPLVQDQAHYVFKWNGTEANKAVQQVQQMIAAMNVLRGIPPDQLPPGMKLDISPIIEHVAGVAFGPRIAPKVLIDQRHQQSLDPVIENELLQAAFPVSVHPGDNDAEHIQIHQQLLRQGDMQGFVHAHTMEHLAAMKAKSTPPQPKPQGGAQGMPGGAGPGMPGQPRMGAQPGMPRPQQPPGAVHQDQMPLSMPRKAMG